MIDLECERTGILRSKPTRAKRPGNSPECRRRHVEFSKVIRIDIAGNVLLHLECQTERPHPLAGFRESPQKNCGGAGLPVSAQKADVDQPYICQRTTPVRSVGVPGVGGALPDVSS